MLVASYKLEQTEQFTRLINTGSLMQCFSSSMIERFYCMAYYTYIVGVDVGVILVWLCQ